MKVPYNKVHIRGHVLFAARGGRIHSFRLADGSHILTWKHSDVDKVASAVKAIVEETHHSKLPAETEAAPAAKDDGPPAKRQKLVNTESEDDASANPEPKAAAAAAPQTGSARPNHIDGRGKKGKNKGGKENSSQNGHNSRQARVPDRPIITHMTSTENGCYILAITGHDKVIWVFEHDGNGQLKQLSQRTMPKRLSSVVIAPDNRIICADKFGDVYALPLLLTDTDSRSSAPLSSLPLNTKKAFKPSATPLTVHSKGNRQALLNQIKQAELESQLKKEPSDIPDGPNFELSLLLGHVSMLTSLTLGENLGRKYILTSDRDEHIRVSRYIPQAHIIESFCLGHKEFVNNMIIPPNKADVLISGGGDDHLFIWDWVAGKLLSKASILSLAQEIAPDVTKVAVSGLFTLLYPSEAGALIYILAICEDIKAIFSWHLTDGNELNRPGVIQLPGKPLHLALSLTENKTTTLAVAIDPDKQTEAKSLHTFTLTMNEGRLAVDVESSIQDEALEADEADISEEEVRSLMFTVESLRKLLAVGGQEAGSEVQQWDAEGAVLVETDDAIE